MRSILGVAEKKKYKIASIVVWKEHSRARVPVHGKFEIISDKISRNLRKVRKGARMHIGKMESRCINPNEPRSPIA